MGTGEYVSFILSDDGTTLYDLTAGVPAKVEGTPANMTAVTTAMHHQGVLDELGNVYGWGDNSGGWAGPNTPATIPHPTQIATDANGNSFTGITVLWSYNTANGNGFACIKADGTLWLVGNTLGGIRGDGSVGLIANRPVQVVFPAGTVIKDIQVANICLALDTNGTVWDWGADGEQGNQFFLGQGTNTPSTRKPAQVPLPGRVTQISGGAYWNYALLQDGRLFGWAKNSLYLCISPYNPSTSPRLLDPILKLPAPIAQIKMNAMATVVILTDGTMWAWGDNANGNVGNGVETDYSKTKPPYVWNWAEMGLPQLTPVQIGIGIQWRDIKASLAWCFYFFAEDVNSNLYSWGRNKGTVLGNAVVSPDWIAGTTASNLPNSWDVPEVTPVNPLGYKTVSLTDSPANIKNPTKGISIAPKAGLVDQGNMTVNLSCVFGTTVINYYRWKQVSGPGATVIALPTSVVPNVSKLVPGDYIFQLDAIDNHWNTYTGQVSLHVDAPVVVVPPPVDPPPVVVPPPARKVAKAFIVTNTGLTQLPVTDMKFTFDDGTIQ